MRRPTSAFKVFARPFHSFHILPVFLFALAVSMRWRQCEAQGDIPVRRSAHSMAVWENELLVFGGWDGQEELGDLHIFNTGALHCSWNHRAFVVEGERAQRTTSNGFQCTFADTATWRKVTTTGATPRARHFHNCICVDNRLYVFGGYDGENWRNDVRVLDLRASLAMKCCSPAVQSMRFLIPVDVVFAPPRCRDEHLAAGNDHAHGTGSTCERQCLCH